MNRKKKRGENMKKIEAIIRPENLEQLKDELLKANISGMTINQIYGCGNQYGYKEHVRANEVIVNTLPKVEVKLIIPDERLDEIVDLIISVTQSGEYGDGKIFVYDVVDCIRIRTKERGDKAL